MKPSCVESSELNTQDFVTLKKNAPVKQNGSLANALQLGPLTFTNSNLLKNPRASSATSLPLMVTGSIQPDQPISSPLTASFSSNSSSTSPLTSVILSSVFVGDFRPLVPQMGPRFRASSCHPLGRLIMNPVDTNFCWPSACRPDEERPLDLSTKLSSKPKIDSPNALIPTIPTINRLAESAPVPGGDPIVPSLRPASNASHLLTNNVQDEITATESTKPENGRTRRRRATAARRPIRKFTRDLPQSEQRGSLDSAQKDGTLPGIGQESSSDLYSVLSDTEDYRTKTSCSVQRNDASRVRARRSQSAGDSRTSPTQISTSITQSDTAQAIGSDASSSVTETTPQSTRPSLILQRRRLTTRPGGADQAVCNPRMRRYPEMTPNEVKDDAYWEKRVKNNEAARRSRRARKSKEQSLRDYADKLEKTNSKLLEEIKLLKQEVCRLKSESTQRKNGAIE